MHGSLTKDLDVVAIPWTEESADAVLLVEAIRSACLGTIVADGATAKPHGRYAYTILLDDGAGYVDLSVIPRRQQWEAWAHGGV